MAGNGNRGGSVRTAGGKPVTQARLMKAIGTAYRSRERLRQRRQQIVREGPYSRSLDRRIGRMTQRYDRLQTLQQRQRAADGAAMRRRGKGYDLPKDWPTGRQLWPGIRRI